MTNTPPATEEIAAAAVGLKLAIEQHEHLGIRPQGEGNNVEPVTIRITGSLHECIKTAMMQAQQRWPNAKNWEVIGADTYNWKGAQTYAQFTWPQGE